MSETPLNWSVDWFAIPSEDIIILSRIAASYGSGINLMTHNLERLRIEDRETVERILDVARRPRDETESEEPLMRLCPHCGQHHYVKDGEFYCPLDPNKA